MVFKMFYGRKSGHKKYKVTRARTTIAAVCALGTVAAACGTSTAQPNASAAKSSSANAAVGDTLTYANSSGPLSLDPAIMGNGRVGAYAQPAYDSLITIQPNGSLTPDLATSWQFAPGSQNKTFVINLRHGVKFSDGEAMTATAVVNSIKYFQKKSFFASNLGQVSSIVASGPNQVTISLSAPNPELPYALDQYWQLGDIISPAGLSNPTQLGTATFGAGPYVLDPSQTISQNTYTYTPNPYYWNKAAVRWKKIVIKVFANTNSALQALEGGQVQAMVGSVPLAQTLAGNTAVKVLSSKVQWSGVIITDRQGKIVPALAHVRVRQALNYAIGRSAINNALYGKFGAPTDQIQGPGFIGYSASFANQYKYNLAKAKSLLAQAGYPHGFSMTLLEQGTTQTNLMAEAVVGQLAKIGVQATIKNDTTFTQFLQDGLSEKYPAFVGELNMSSPYLTYLEDFQGSHNLWNPFGVVNAQRLSEISQAVAEPASQASGLWKTIWVQTMQRADWIPISESPVLYFISSSVNAVAPGQELSLNPLAITPAG